MKTKQIKLIRSQYAYESRIWEITDNKITVAISNALVRNALAVCNGIVDYDSERKAYRLTPTHYEQTGYRMYYNSTALIENAPPFEVREGEAICRKGVIKLGGLKEIQGFIFWIEKDNKIVNPLPFITGGKIEVPVLKEKDLTETITSDKIKEENKSKKNNKKKKSK